MYSIWLKNGTYRYSVDLGGGPVVKLIRFYPDMLYVTRSEVGYLKVSAGKKGPVMCQKPNGNVVDVVTELASNHVFYVLLESGEILVYDMNLSSKTCSSTTHTTHLTQPT